MVNVRAGLVGVEAVVHGEIVGDETRAGFPVPHLARPVGVRRVALVPAGEPAGDLEEATVADAVLVRPARAETRALPVQAAAAGGRIPGADVVVEDALRELEPLRLAGRRVGEVELGRVERRHPPETLVVVAFVARLFGHHEVELGSDLGKQRLADLAIIGGVACEIPVFEEGHHQCARFPPVL